MSHEATNWAIKQRGIRPAAKVVLWHLCDRYHKDHGCFPSLDTLAEDCEMSRRSVQDQIDALVDAGLIRVEKKEREKGRLPLNSYRFPFEFFDDAGEPLANFALGKFTSSPLANSRRRLGQNLPTNLVREPLKETARARGAAPPPNKGGAPPRDDTRCADRQRHISELFAELQSKAMTQGGQK